MTARGVPYARAPHLVMPENFGGKKFEFGGGGGVPNSCGGVWGHIVGRFCNALWDRYPPPPVDRQTENITIVILRMAGGKYYTVLLAEMPINKTVVTVIFVPCIVLLSIAIR